MFPDPPSGGCGHTHQKEGLGTRLLVTEGKTLFRAAFKLRGSTVLTHCHQCASRLATQPERSSSMEGVWLEITAGAGHRSSGGSG